VRGGGGGGEGWVCGEGGKKNAERRCRLMWKCCRSCSL